MNVCFTIEQEERVLHLLESIQTAREAVNIMVGQLTDCDFVSFAKVAETLAQLISNIQQASVLYREELDTITLPITCECALYSLRVICNALPANPEKAEIKLRYELAPTLEEAYMQFYYWAHVHGHQDREERYYREEMFELASNPYANVALETGKFKYDVAFMVTGYNHLDYTKMCVENLLENIPKGLNYELILRDNGSTDGTEEYFESIHPTKLIKSKTNHGIGGAASRAVEAKYLFGISNDVIVLPGVIENMLECISSADDIAWVVPTTPHVSNLQTIQAQYQNKEELYAFARQNNLRNPYRWEQRVRLCNPIDVSNMLLTRSKRGLCNNGYLGKNVMSFPDDRLSLLCRRAGYKMYLAKDSYCHHFGSVTLKDEIAQYNEQKFYAEGRQKFFDQFGVDPWGTGFCFAPPFLERVVGEHSGHVDVLGINCGLGSNSLKIKEQIKEYCRNTDCALTNITDDKRFILDLKGVSDFAEIVEKIKAFKEVLYRRSFDYIVWETPFLTQHKFSTLFELCLNHLTQNGLLLIKQSEQTSRYLRENASQGRAIGSDWLEFRRQEGA